MNKEKALRILAASAAYKVGQGTKNAYKAYKNTADAWNKAIGKNVEKYNAIGAFDPQKSAYYQNAYQSLKQAYQNSGRQSMQNAIASAAANTGGYGNSYGASAGNQAYQERMAALAGQVPSLYTAAAQEHAAQKENLANTIGLQQAQQAAALSDAQYRLRVQQALDEQRYRLLLARVNAAKDNAKLWLSANT